MTRLQFTPNGNLFRTRLTTGVKSKLGQTLYSAFNRYKKQLSFYKRFVFFILLQCNHWLDSLCLLMKRSDKGIVIKTTNWPTFCHSAIVTKVKKNKFQSLPVSFLLGISLPPDSPHLGLKPLRNKRCSTVTTTSRPEIACPTHEDV